MQLRIVSKNYTRASLRKISCFKKLYQGLSYNNFSCEQWRQESKVFCTVSVAKNLFKVTRRDWRRCFCFFVFVCLFLWTLSLCLSDTDRSTNHFYYETADQVLLYLVWFFARNIVSREVEFRMNSGTLNWNKIGRVLLHYIKERISYFTLWSFSERWL